MWRQNKKSKPSFNYDFCKVNCFAWRYVVVYTRNDTEQVILNSNQSENKQKDNMKTCFPFQVTRIQTTDKGASLRDLYPGAAYHIQVWQQHWPHLRHIFEWSPRPIFTTLQVFAVSHGLQSEPHRSFQAVTPNPPRNLTIAAVQVVIIKSNDYRVNILQCIWHCLFLTKSLQTDRISLAGQSSKLAMEDADLLSVHGVPRQVPHVRGSRPESVECSDCCGTYCNHVHPHRPPAWRAVWDSGSIKELFLTCAVLLHFLWPGGLCVPPRAKREAHRSDANNR